MGPLSNAGCDVWVARISELTRQNDALDALLTGEERAEVDRRRHDRSVAVASRVLLRLLLARYLDSPLKQVEIDRTCSSCALPHGKPRLRSSSAASAPAVQFSVSHGGELLVLAFSGGGRLGVDVEPLGTGQDVATEVAEYALTTEERHHLQEVPPADRTALFLRYWTAKEAALKAAGTGLMVSPQSVRLLPPRGWRTATVTAPPSPPLRLWLRQLDADAAHVSSLATDHPVREPSLRTLRPSEVQDLLDSAAEGGDG